MIRLCRCSSLVWIAYLKSKLGRQCISPPSSSQSHALRHTRTLKTLHTDLLGLKQQMPFKRKEGSDGGRGGDGGKKLIQVSTIKTRHWGSRQSSSGQLTSTDSLVKCSPPFVTPGPDHPGCRLSRPYASFPLPSGWLPASPPANRENLLIPQFMSA